MKNQANRDDVSFDRLNAFVDGELDALDEGRVLEAIRHDPVLAREACELRLAKDLVRHAYPLAADAGNRHHGRSGRRWLTLAAAAVMLLAIGAGGGWLGRAWQQDDDYSRIVARAGAVLQAGAADRVLLHVSSSAPERVAAMLDETEEMLAAARSAGRPVAIEVLANSSGLDVLRPDASAAAARLETLHKQYPNLTLVACGQTIERLREKGIAVHLVPDATVATSALDEVVRRIHEGWTYVRA